MKTIGILHVEDHDLISEGVREILLRSDLKCKITVCNNADDALKTLHGSPIDVVLLDLILESKRSAILGNGDELLKEIKRRKLNTKVIVVSMISTIETLNHVVNNLDADGYILKSKTSSLELVPAIVTVMSGKKYLSEAVKKRMEAYDKLIDIDIIDREILLSLANGYLQYELPAILRKKGTPLKMRAIEARIGKLKDHFGVKTPTQLISIAIKKGIITP